MKTATRHARSLEFQPPVEEAVKEGMAVAPADAENIQPGILWTHSIGHVLKHFVPLASRTFHVIRRDERILKTLTPRDPDRAVFSATNRARLHGWLIAKCSIQNPNSFYLMFRSLAFECSMASNGWKVHSSRKSSRASKLTSAESIIDEECGFHAISRLHSLLKGDLMPIARDVDHEFHAHLLLVMFAFVYRQTFRVDFLKTIYFSNQRVDAPEMKEFMAKIKWGMHQRPVVVELQRQLYVLDISGSEQDTGPKVVERIQCRDMYDALLYWIHLMHTKYDDELLDTSKIISFYKSIIPQ
jgi:hypothetical protein